MTRACSYRERDPYLRSDDWVAAVLVPGFLRLGCRTPLFRHVWRRTAAPGMYEWVVARTRYVDAVFRSSSEAIAQILIMGAGYDSRAIRFARELGKTRIFELDAARPQEDKLRGLKLRKLTVPPNLTFVPVDFETASAADALARAGFEAGKPTLYVLEGLTMYLTPEAVEVTFGLIAQSAGSGSVVVFDHAYASVVTGDQTAFGASGLMSQLAKRGEAWNFGLEAAGVGPFLERFGFEVSDQASPDELARRFLTDGGGRLHGNVNGTQALVTARRL